MYPTEHGVGCCGKKEGTIQMMNQINKGTHNVNNGMNSLHWNLGLRKNAHHTTSFISSIQYEIFIVLNHIGVA